MTESECSGAPTLCEHVKAEPAAPPLVDSAYARGQQWQEEFHNHMTLQCLQLGDIQATGRSEVPDPCCH
jgi:hypothetical protein